MLSIWQDGVRTTVGATDFLFSHSSRRDLRPTHILEQRVPGNFCSRKSGRSVTLMTPEAHSYSYTKGTGNIFQEGKRPERDSDEPRGRLIFLHEGYPEHFPGGKAAGAWLWWLPPHPAPRWRMSRAVRLRPSLYVLWYATGDLYRQVFNKTIPTEDEGSQREK
jgi:hypothetical protein